MREGGKKEETQHKNGWTTCYANETYTKQKNENKQ